MKPPPFRVGSFAHTQEGDQGVRPSTSRQEAGVQKTTASSPESPQVPGRGVHQFTSGQVGGEQEASSYPDSDHSVDIE